MFIYAIVNSETLKVYIGQHKGNNLRQYLQQKLSEARRQFSERSKLYASMRNHPRECWSIWPLISGVESKAELDALEKHFIRVLKTQHDSVGYNICAGGGGTFGAKHKPEDMRRMRALSHSPEAQKKRNATIRANNFKGPWLGKTFSGDHKKNLSSAHKGVSWSHIRRAAFNAGESDRRSAAQKEVWATTRSER